MKSKTATMSSTEKALKIMMAFTPHNHPMGTLELSKKLGIHKSTVSRLLNLLADNGFLQKNSETKKYMLGRAAAEIGNAVLRSLNNEIVTIAQPHLNELCEAVGESVALEVVSGTNVVLAYHCEGRRHIRFSFQLGEQVPLHVAAGAKTILAHSPPEFVELCLQGKLNRFTDNTIVSKTRFRKLLSEVRETGLAYDNGERYEDTRAIATPILNHDGNAVAAVVIAGPAFRLTPEFLKDVVVPLKQTAADISQRMFP
ncbi:MAG: IclR family transcriptional regulator [Desulfobacteraceae bacterium]|jgi:DNA-binding IclR family transcriptional regulator